MAGDRPMPFADLLGRGYFPKELPPCFSTAALADLAKAQPLPPPPNVALVCEHSLARAGGSRRRLGIPNPFHFAALAREIANNWQVLQLHLARSRLSLSTPTRFDGADERAVGPRVDRGEIPEQRARHRTLSRYLLRADVAECYHTLYTHSIPWALHTKAAAKRNRGPGLLGNRLDLMVRNGQDGQTNGIPVGPDTSLIIAETVLAAVDARLHPRLPRRGRRRPAGFRYYDDFEFSFATLAEAEEALAVIEESLLEFAFH